MGIFVNPEDVFTINFVTATATDGITTLCDVNEEKLREVNDDLDEKTIVQQHCVFRYPTLADNAAIEDSGVGYDHGQMTFNPSQSEIKKLSLLLKSWSLTDESGKVVPITEKTIAALNSSVGAVISYLLNQKI